jgi:hypothetical protein
MGRRYYGLQATPEEESRVVDDTISFFLQQSFSSLEDSILSSAKPVILSKLLEPISDTENYGLEFQWSIFLLLEWILLHPEN